MVCYKHDKLFMCVPYDPKQFNYYRMKRVFFIVSVLVLATGLTAQNVLRDTTVHFNQKVIHILDDAEQVTVKVYDQRMEPLRQMYEGIFADGKSYEKWTVLEEVGIQLPFITPKKKKSYKMEPHWAGFGWGFVNISNADYQLNNIDGVSLKSEDSREFYFNFSERIIPIYQNTIGLTTGMGFSWKNYHLKSDQFFSEVNGVTRLLDAPDDIRYKYSRLRMVYFNVPLLLEWQPGTGKKNFFMSAGVVGGVNTMASFKARYNEGLTRRYVKEKGLNAAPVTIDYMAQIGFKSWSVYGKYSPFSIFQSQKGPDIRSVSVGATLNF
jgi:hypothetical protein